MNGKEKGWDGRLGGAAKWVRVVQVGEGEKEGMRWGKGRGLGSFFMVF